MRKQLHLVILLAITCSLSFAQGNMALTGSNFFSSASSRYLPSKLGGDPYTFEFNFAQAHVYLGNTTIEYGTLRPFVIGDSLTNDDLERSFGSVREENNIAFGLDFIPLQTSFAIKSSNKRKKRPLLIGQLGVALRSAANINLSGNLLKMAYEGNEQFRGESVDLGPIRVSGNVYAEYMIGAAVPLERMFSLFGRDVDLVPAVRLRYLQGIVGFATKSTDISMFTEAEGREINFNYDYSYNYATPYDSNGVQTTNFAGRGFAADLGLGMHLGEDIEVHVGLINLGSINYNKNAYNFTKQGEYRYEGFEVTLTDGTREPEDIGEVLDSVLLPDETAENFTAPLGSMLILQGDYKLGKTKTYKNGIPYHKHHVFVQYAQGFSNKSAATKNPFLGVGYGATIKYALNVGGTLNIGGYNKFTLGAFMGVRGGPFKMGISSNNINWLFAPNGATGLDLNFHMAIAIHTKIRVRRAYNLGNIRRF